MSFFSRLVAASCLCSAVLAQTPTPWVSPPYTDLYSEPLPIPPQAVPRFTLTNPVTGGPIQYYEIDIHPFQQQIYPNLGPADLVGYNGIAPGPTFIIPRGTESVVRFINNAELPNSVHLHGSPSRAPFDGWAEDVTQPGQYKDYYFPNYQSARTLWYHDHAMSITAENSLHGQAGVYIVSDPAEDALNLPSGYGEYDIPLVLGSKFYNADGTIATALNERDSYWGDVIHVNGQPWPFLNVEPRKYRFRFLDASVSRNFGLFLEATSAVGTRIPFQVIASDAGLLEEPITVSELYVAVAERYEVVVDFSGFAGQDIDLRNLDASQINGRATDLFYPETGKVMRFHVSPDPVTDDSVVPTALRDVPFPPATTSAVRTFTFNRGGTNNPNREWRINGVGFTDVANRVLASVPRGTVELWDLVGGGGWTHPVHVHLVDFRIVSRSNGNQRGVEPYEAAGLKDVVWLARGETVRVQAHYQPWAGAYMFHCHNLIHEDADMMAAFNVTQLEDLGYTEVTDFFDPMDPRWRAVPFVADEYTTQTGAFSSQAISDRIEELALQEPYSEREEVEQALEDYWSQNGAVTTRDEESGRTVRRFEA
jgi:bilirubin oxidase